MNRSRTRASMADLLNVSAKTPLIQSRSSIDRRARGQFSKSASASLARTAFSNVISRYAIGIGKRNPHDCAAVGCGRNSDVGVPVQRGAGKTEPIGERRNTISAILAAGFLVRPVAMQWDWTANRRVGTMFNLTRDICGEARLVEHAFGLGAGALTEAIQLAVLQ